MFVEIHNLRKSYGEGTAAVNVLNNIDMHINKGEICVILGPSGSGKSTLLNLIGGLDSPDNGILNIDGHHLSEMNQKQLLLYRRDYLGFVFQFYNLIPNLTVLENIQVCKYLAKNPLNINEMMDILGLTEHKDKFPFQLSGGQQQRCAIARALVKNPDILLCDEPTGALDYKNSKEILILLERINMQYNTTMIIVTHNEVLKDMVHRVIRVKDGKISKAYTNKTLIPAREIEW